MYYVSRLRSCAWNCCQCCLSHQFQWNLYLVDRSVKSVVGCQINLKHEGIEFTRCWVLSITLEKKYNANKSHTTWCPTPKSAKKTWKKVLNSLNYNARFFPSNHITLKFLFIACLLKGIVAKDNLIIMIRWILTFLEDLLCQIFSKQRTVCYFIRRVVKKL